MLYWIVTARGKIKVLDTGIQNIHNIIEHVYNHRTFDIGYPPPTPSSNGFTLGTYTISTTLEHVYNHRTFDIGCPPPTPSRNGFTLGTLEGFGGTYRYQDL